MNIDLSHFWVIHLISIMIGLCILYSRSHGPIRLAGCDVSVNSDLVHVILGPCETFWMHFGTCGLNFEG